ncbi:hypothetical protein NHX12_000815 [Muraenolepis orangiensis]|uniref:Uncharacterized protein n=1 Tax=Muraenolepis orangiensis TaxID=630683 RepID=A0A9Q0E3C6_9TELE|nr:hypothetical protein NHX12_000815 [Muraenolepis orangiensis]
MWGPVGRRSWEDEESAERQKVEIWLLSHIIFPCSCLSVESGERWREEERDGEKRRGGGERWRREMERGGERRRGMERRGEGWREEERWRREMERGGERRRGMERGGDMEERDGEEWREEERWRREMERDRERRRGGKIMKCGGQEGMKRGRERTEGGGGGFG